MNIIVTYKDALIADFETIKDTVFDTSALLQERAGLQAEMNVIAEQIEKCIAENTRIYAKMSLNHDGLETFLLFIL